MIVCNMECVSSLFSPYLAAGKTGRHTSELNWVGLWPCATRVHTQKLLHPSAVPLDGSTAARARWSRHAFRSFVFRSCSFDPCPDWSSCQRMEPARTSVDIIPTLHSRPRVQFEHLAMADGEFGSDES